MAVPNKIFIPTFISSVTYQPVRTLPHIYFYNGLKDCEPYFIEHYQNGSTSVVENTQQEKFPYFDYYDGLEPTTGSNSLLFFNETPPYGVTPTGSLYTNYWSKYVSLLYNPRTRLINASAIIPLADYFEMELNDIVQWRGNYYHLRALNDYNLKDGTCKLQLLGPILDDALTITQLDCSFNFDVFAAPTTSTTQSPTTTRYPGACTRWAIETTGANTGYWNYTDCQTGVVTLIGVPAGGTRTVCSRTTPTYSSGGIGYTYSQGSCNIIPTTSTTLSPTTTASPTTSTTTLIPTTSTTTLPGPTTTLAPTTSTTLAPTTTTTTITPGTPLSLFRVDYNSSGGGTIGSFVDFNGTIRPIPNGSYGNGYDFVGYSGSVSLIPAAQGGFSVLTPVVSYPTFTTYRATKTTGTGLVAWTYQSADGELDYNTTSGTVNSAFCAVTNTARETFDPLSRLLITIEGACSPSLTTTTSTTLSPTTSTTTDVPTTSTTTQGPNFFSLQVTNNTTESIDFARMTFEGNDDNLFRLNNIGPSQTDSTSSLQLVTRVPGGNDWTYDFNVTGSDFKQFQVTSSYEVFGVTFGPSVSNFVGTGSYFERIPPFTNVTFTNNVSYSLDMIINPLGGQYNNIYVNFDVLNQNSNNLDFARVKVTTGTPESEIQLNNILSGTSASLSGIEAINVDGASQTIYLEWDFAGTSIVDFDWTGSISYDGGTPIVASGSNFNSGTFSYLIDQEQLEFVTSMSIDLQIRNV
jgi:hypothetical protein